MKFLSILFFLMSTSLYAVCPTISVKTPVANVTLSGTQPFEASAADDNPGLEVTFWYNGVNYFNIEKTAPYLWSVDTHMFADGIRTVEFQAKDSGGCIKKASVSFSVKNAPTPTPTISPTPVPSSTPQTSPSPSQTPAASPNSNIFPASNPVPGYTTLKPSADSRIIYVSISGSDSNDGLSPAKAIQTPSLAFSKIRKGYPDWIVFKSGDVWNRRIVGLGNGGMVGRSATEPAVISRYGSGPRPRFNINNENGFEANGGVYDFVMEGIHIRGRIMEDSTVKSAQAVRMVLGPGANILFENNVFEKVNDGISISDGSVAKKNVTFRRNIVADVITRDTGWAGRSSCIYASSIVDLKLIENVWDLCGWDPAQPKTWTVFSHDAYIADTVYNLYAFGNIFSRGSEDGLKMRRGGVAEDNFFIQNGIGVSVNDYALSNIHTVLKNNVITDGSLNKLWDYSSTPQVRNYATLVKSGSGSTYSQSGDVMLMSPIGAQGSVVFSGIAGSATLNKVWKWGRSASSSGTFSDPNRTIERYQIEVLKVPANRSDFYLKMRDQSRESYKPAYSAAAINRYFRAGFQ